MAAVCPPRPRKPFTGRVVLLQPHRILDNSVVLNWCQDLHNYYHRLPPPATETSPHLRLHFGPIYHLPGGIYYCHHQSDGPLYLIAEPTPYMDPFTLLCTSYSSQGHSPISDKKTSTDFTYYGTTLLLGIDCLRKISIHHAATPQENYVRPTAMHGPPPLLTSFG